MCARFLTRTVAAATVAMFAVVMALPASAGSKTQDPRPVRLGARSSTASVQDVDPPYTELWDQYDTPSWTGWFSTTDPDQYLMADDFTVPPGTTWAIDEVDADGADYGAPPSSFVIAFYEDTGGLPGSLVQDRPALTATRSPGFWGPQAHHSFDLGDPVLLGPGAYWMSIGGAMPTPGDLWSWSARAITNGSPVAWGRQGVGFFGHEAGDLLFALGGTAIPNVPPCTITGTDADEGIIGSSATDYICGGPGRDQLAGRGGNDVVKGGMRGDQLDGEAGNDLLLGKNGPDILFDELGTDRMMGGAGADKLLAIDGSGGDVLNGGPGIDICRGDPGDVMIGCEPEP
jgi:hypothetical protein